MTIWLKIEKIHEDANIPKYVHSGDSCFDLESIEDVELSFGEVKLIKTGLRFDIPEGHEVQIRPRSGLAAKHGITVVNTPGTVDSSYLGEIKIILTKLKNDGEIFKISKHDRIAQAALVPVMQAVISEEKITKHTDRGENGFGSTGLK
jgi:dUTP pyrophosphatase